MLKLLAEPCCNKGCRTYAAARAKLRQPAFKPQSSEWTCLVGVAVIPKTCFGLIHTFLPPVLFKTRVGSIEFKFIHRFHQGEQAHEKLHIVGAPSNFPSHGDDIQESLTSVGAFAGLLVNRLLQ